MNKIALAFVASLVATTACRAETDPPAPLMCAGTEPFWNFRLGGETTVIATPDDPGTPLAISDYRAAINQRGEWSAKIGDNVAVIRQVESCSDGMSDEEFPYAVTLVTPENTLSGCCRPFAE